MLVIGVSGRARHGKTSACEAIIKHVSSLDQKAKLFDIGDEVRKYCIEKELLPKVARKDMTREQLEVLIETGKHKRKENANYWIDLLLEEMHATKNKDIDVALFPNIRYVNEAAAIRKEGGYLIGCKRYNEDGSDFISPDRPANDISETGMRFIVPDYYINTKSGEDILVGKIAITIFEHIKGEHARRIAATA
jgi:hypothetical protein